MFRTYKECYNDLQGKEGCKMARGGHHGGGFHSGGHHGGGFHGGGFHGGSFHSSGSHYHGGSYGSGDGDDFLPFFIIRLSIYAISLLITAILSTDGVPGLDIANLFIFIATIVIFFLAFKDTGESENLYKLRKADPGLLTGRVCNLDHGGRALGSVGNNQTWYCSYSSRYNYAISFLERDTRDEHVRRVTESVKRTPAILWVSFSLWISIAVICFIANFFFYEAVIPIFENKVMTDAAFAFIDDFIFYLPSVLALLSSIACLVIRKMRDRVLYECAKDIVIKEQVFEKRKRKEQEIRTVYLRKLYYNHCPNCGAEAASDLISCPFCSASLEVVNQKGVDPLMIHHLSTKGIEKMLKIQLDEKEGKEGKDGSA